MLIVANKSGQLANRLFLFGHLIAFIKENGGTLLNPSFEEYAPYFSYTDRDVLCKFPPSAVPLPKNAAIRRRYFWLVDRWMNRRVEAQRAAGETVPVVQVSADQVCVLDAAPFLPLSKKHLLLLTGWNYRNYAAFDKHADFIRQMFQPTPPIQTNVDAAIAACRTRGEVVIGVHIRWGDYRAHRGGCYYYEPPQYAAVMRSAAALFPGKTVHFLLCSNEPVDLNEFAEFSACLGPNHLVEDLYTFAKCDYLLGPPSTYTLWASFMGRVPLCMIVDPARPVTLADFALRGGNCDVPEDVARWVPWPQEPPLSH